MRRHHDHHHPRFGENIDRADRRRHDGPYGAENPAEGGPERRGRGRGGRGRRGPDDPDRGRSDAEGFDPDGFRPEGFGGGGPRGFGPRGFGPGGFGPGGFGPGGFGPGGRDPEGFGPDRRGGPGRRGGGPVRRGRGPHRAPRGDVRTAVLLLLAEEPMHGYQLMQTITERTGSRWRPSPGAIYPTLSQLEDEGLVATEKSGGRKLASLTEAGRTHVEENSSSWTDPFPAAAHSVDDEVIDLRELGHGLMGALREVARTGTDSQVREAATLLEEARRCLYTILAGPSAASQSTQTDPPAGPEAGPDAAEGGAAGETGTARGASADESPSAQS